MLRTCTATLDGKLTLWRTVLLSVLISPVCTKVVQDWERARYAGRTKYALTGNVVAPAKYNSLLAYPHLAAREGLTDEQYVRSVLRVIYGGGRG